MKKMPKELRSIQAIAVIIAAVLYFGIKAMPFSRHISSGDVPAKGDYFYVTRVVDGDTLKLSNGQRVRLIGVDTPEVHYSKKLLRDARRTNRDIAAIQTMGKKASDFTKKLCLDKKVRMEFDVTKKDRYGRLLAYIYLEDGTFINARILEEGYGQVMTIPPNVKYADQFLKLQQKARAAGKGLWAATDNM